MIKKGSFTRKYVIGKCSEKGITFKRDSGYFPQVFGQHNFFSSILIDHVTTPLH